MSNIPISNTQRQELLNSERARKLSDRQRVNLENRAQINRVNDDAVDIFRAQSLKDNTQNILDNLDKIESAIDIMSRSLNILESADNILAQIEELINQSDNIDTQLSAQQIHNLVDRLNHLITGGKDQQDNLFNNNHVSISISIGLNKESTLDVEATDIRQDGLIFDNKIYYADSKQIEKEFFDSPDKGKKIIAEARQNITDKADDLTTIIAVLQTRSDFASLFTGDTDDSNRATDISLKDLDEEAANLIALQARGQLGVRNFTIAADKQRNIISLLGNE